MQLAAVVEPFVAAGDDVVAVGVGASGVVVVSCVAHAPWRPCLLNTDDVEVLVVQAGHRGLKLIDLLFSSLRSFLWLSPRLDVEGRD
eukprot:2855466-Pyramimonas_sp.AAC.1